jgi:hypothetical protein
MKLTNETIFTSGIVIGLGCLLYSHMDLHRKVKRVDEYINLIMSTHLQYMENRNKQTEDIKTINETLEQIALSLPYKGTGWQTKFIESKFNRELEHHQTPPEVDEFNDKSFYDDE